MDTNKKDVRIYEMKSQTYLQCDQQPRLSCGRSWAQKRMLKIVLLEI
jgi:hypothetical protein